MNPACREGVRRGQLDPRAPIHHQALSYDRTYVSQCLVFDENSACWIPIRHKILSYGNVGQCMS